MSRLDAPAEDVGIQTAVPDEYPLSVEHVVVLAG
jgi:hypothetical protein